ncbi:MAG TPA: GNAT family N-acetyltransferase [Puia sp.]|nr:GNAT family N-acetyltransferase [Puia sp.]
MELAGLSLIKVNTATDFKPFDCGDEDLNDFLLSKSKHYQIELLAVTYLLENEERTIAFFSIFNDSLRVQEKEFASKSAFKRLLSRLVTHPKRHLEYYPALKIGRLGVCNTIKKSGVGTAIINFIISIAMDQNESCACKLITVDAYDKSLGFYEKLGFTYFTETDKGKDTRQMYLDLTPIMNASLEEQSGKIH